MRSVVGRVVVAGIAVAATACTSSATQKPEPPPTPTPTPPTTAVAVSTPVLPPTTAASAPSSAPPTSSAVPTTPAPVTSSAAAGSTCTSIDIRVIRGSASLGQEVAALQFVNSGTASCVLVGYPSVILLRNGRKIGVASEPSSSALSRRTLAPGEVAESLLHDYTQTCQAPLSDNIRVTAPGGVTTAVRPAQLRACVIRIDKLGAPD